MRSNDYFPKLTFETVTRPSKVARHDLFNSTVILKQKAPIADGLIVLNDLTRHEYDNFALGLSHINLLEGEVVNAGFILDNPIRGIRVARYDEESCSDEPVELVDYPLCVQLLAIRATFPQDVGSPQITFYDPSGHEIGIDLAPYDYAAVGSVLCNHIDSKISKLL